MTKLPQVTAQETLKKLKRSGMIIKRKAGPHYVLYGEGGRYAVVPKHPSYVLIENRASLCNFLTGPIIQKMIQPKTKDTILPLAISKS